MMGSSVGMSERALSNEVNMDISVSEDDASLAEQVEAGCGSGAADSDSLDAAGGCDAPELLLADVAAGESELIDGAIEVDGIAFEVHPVRNWRIVGKRFVRRMLTALHDWLRQWHAGRLRRRGARRQEQQGDA